MKTGEGNHSIYSWPPSYNIHQYKRIYDIEKRWIKRKKEWKGGDYPNIFAEVRIVYPRNISTSNMGLKTSK